MCFLIIPILRADATSTIFGRPNPSSKTNTHWRSRREQEDAKWQCIEKRISLTEDAIDNPEQMQ